MSQRTFNELWAKAEAELGDLLATQEGKAVTIDSLVALYAQYIQIFRRLEEAYDQVVHPQKRRLIRRTLDCVMGRVLELKNEMVLKEFSECHYMDDALHHLRLMPEDLEIPVPRFFLTECSEEVQECKQMLANMLKTVEPEESLQAVEDLRPEEPMMILPVTQKPKQAETTEPRPMKLHTQREMDAAARPIQRMWRGFISRRKTKVAREEEQLFLGMTLDPIFLVPQPAEIAAEANKAFTRTKQESLEEEYQSAVVSVTAQVWEEDAPTIRENMKDQIRKWFIESRDGEGFFPDYPELEDGGSALLLTEKNPRQLMQEIARKGIEEQKGPGKGKDLKKAKPGKGKEEEEEEEVQAAMLPSAFLSDLETGHRTFVDIWKNRDESDNLAQQHEEEFIKDDQTKVIEAEIRIKVDEEMILELNDLKQNVDKVKLGKAKSKKKKGKREPKENDLTPDSTLESLCQELVDEGLLKPANNVRMQDYLGDYSYIGAVLREGGAELMPTWSDVRQVLSVYAVLPLGSPLLHEKTPLVKTILLAGPEGVGKKMLVHAICQETGATLFDLSPANIMGKYPGRSGLTMMLHLVFKVSRLVQPSVIWIGEVERMFDKRPPEEENELDPNRLKTSFPKSLKLIRAEHRVVVIGTTSDPMSAVLKSMCKVFPKIIIVPRPDYGSRYVLWRELIKKHGGELTEALNISDLAKASDGHTQGQMVKVIQRVLNRRRLLEQASRPLTAAEFTSPLKFFDTVFKEEETLKKWYAKTPLAKKRAKAQVVVEEEDAADRDAKKKGKK